MRGANAAAPAVNYHHVKDILVRVHPQRRPRMSFIGLNQFAHIGKLAVLQDIAAARDRQPEPIKGNPRIRLDLHLSTHRQLFQISRHLRRENQGIFIRPKLRHRIGRHNFPHGFVFDLDLVVLTITV